MKQNAEFYWTQEESWTYAVTKPRFLALSGCIKQQDWLALWIRKKWHKAPSEPDPLHPTTVENRSSSRWATYNTISTVGRWPHPAPQSSNKDGDKSLNDSLNTSNGKKEEIVMNHTKKLHGNFNPRAVGESHFQALQRSNYGILLTVLLLFREGLPVIWELCSSLVGRGKMSKIMQGPVLRSVSYRKQTCDFSSF